MYCQKCGTSNPVGAKFCSGCGAALVTSPVSKPNVLSRFNIGKNKILAVAAVVILILLVIIIAVGTNHPDQKAAKEYMQAVINGNMGKIYNLLPESILDSYIGDGLELDFFDSDEYKEYQEEWSDEFYERYGIRREKVSKAVKYEILSDKKMSKAKLETLKDLLVDGYGADPDSFSAARLLKVRLSLTWNDPKYSESVICLLCVAKSDGKWYSVEHPLFEMIDGGNYDYRDEFKQIFGKTEPPFFMDGWGVIWAGFKNKLS